MSDRADEYGTTRLHFFADGDLLFSVISATEEEVFRLTYVTVGGEIISDQPSAPRQERTRYTIEDPRILLLERQGVRTRYLKIQS